MLWVENYCVICIIIVGKWGGGDSCKFDSVTINWGYHHNHKLKILHSQIFFAEYIPLWYWTRRRQRVSGFGPTQQYMYLFK